MTWLDEFRDASYDVPAVITGAAGITDLSWRNDACPSFGTYVDDAYDLRIWVNHPDESLREFPTRYLVTLDVDGEFHVVYEGESAERAVEVYEAKRLTLGAE